MIDKEFTNEYENENKYMTGILTMDYPIFHITLCQNKPKKK